MSGTRSQNHMAEQMQINHRPRKRKAKSISTDFGTDKESSIDQDDDIVQIARKLAAESQRNQENRRQLQQREFIAEMEVIGFNSIPKIFATPEAQREMSYLFNQFAEKIMKKAEVDRQLDAMTTLIRQKLGNALRSVQCAIDLRMTELNISKDSLEDQDDV